VILAAIYSIESFSLLSFVGYAALLVALVWGVGFVVSVVVVHRRLRMRARPVFMLTQLENLPITFRATLGDWIGQMRDLGFVVVGNATYQEPMAPIQVTHCLLVNRSEGVRAGIMCAIHQRKYIPFATFVSEYADGTKVFTNNRGLIPREDALEPLTRFEVMPRSTTIKDLYTRHIAHARQHAPTGQASVLPPPGTEMEFLAKRHAESRARVMWPSDWTLDKAGEFYCPTWKRSFIVAAGHNKLFRRCLAWSRRKRIVRSIPEE
jgi:hypothetical protein